MFYKWADGTRAPKGISAQTAGEVCSELRQKGELTAKKLVEISRPEDAPLHKAFDWNDAEAAEKWREQQARLIINHIVIKTEEAKPIRAFFNIASIGNNYEDVVVLLQNKDTREELLKQAKRELKTFRGKYETLAELSGVFKEIDKIEEN